MFGIYSAEFTKFQNNDCLYDKNIDYFKSNKHPNYEDCSTWCRDHKNCAGYAVYNNVCYFKNKGCRNDLYEKKDTSTFILQGKVNYILFWCHILQTSDAITSEIKFNHIF